MALAYGSRLYGRTDAVPELFHVATQFLHVWFIPICPKQSYIVLEETGDGFRGVPIGDDRKSILIGYARSWSFLSVIGCIAWMGIAFADVSDSDASSREKGLASLATFCFVFLAFLSCYANCIHQYADYDRAMELARKLGPGMQDAVRLYFARNGKLPQAQQRDEDQKAKSTAGTGANGESQKVEMTEQSYETTHRESGSDDDIVVAAVADSLDEIVLVATVAAKEDLTPAVSWDVEKGEMNRTVGNLDQEPSTSSALAANESTSKKKKKKSKKKKTTTTCDRQDNVAKASAEERDDPQPKKKKKKKKKTKNDGFGNQMICNDTYGKNIGDLDMIYPLSMERNNH
jgi:hypothetical protein